MAADDPRELVVFSLHGELYAVGVATVREIVRYIAPGVSAAARGDVRGLINLRGTVLPVVDLSQRLGRELAVDARTRILVLDLAAGPVGLIVDAVEGVQTIPAAAIGPLPASVRDAALGLGLGFGEEIATVGERLVLLVDPERLLDPGAASGLPGNAARPRLSTFLRPVDGGP
ncbi:MAG: chemotaxis protein CheW [Solirubrobacteraceae bacterium]